MVERDDGLEQQEEAVRDLSLARMPVGDPFEEAHRVVAEEAHGAAGERRQGRIPAKSPADREPLELARADVLPYALAGRRPRSRPCGASRS